MLDPGVARSGLHAVGPDHLGRAEVGVQAAAQAGGRADERAVAVAPDQESFLLELEERLADGRPADPERRRQLDLRRELDAVGETAVTDAVADLLADARGELRLADHRHVRTVASGQ